MSVARISALALGLLALALATASAASESGAPLTNEDVVRMVVAGRPEAEIVATIDARPEAFDLSSDMIEELTQAGVTAPVIAAMKRRHEAMTPPPGPPDLAPAHRVPVVVTLNAGGGSRKIQLPDWADEEAKKRFALPKENELRQIKDVAVFLGCVTPEHIPDQWRGKSPLGRDMTATARHEILAFVPGETPAGSAPRIVLPARLEGYVDDGEPHDILLGVAALIGDHWVQVAATHLAKVQPQAGGKPLDGRLKQSGHTLNVAVDLERAK